MAPKNETSAPGTSQVLTERDQRMLCTVLHNNKNAMEIDYNHFAETFGLKNAASARMAWSNMKKKIEAVAGPKKNDGNY
jgi:hypothetical protein